MNNKTLFTLWGVLFILCGACGFIPEPQGILGALLTLLSLVFFLPPAALLYRAWKAKDTVTLKLVRNFSALSLLLTLALLVINFRFALSAEIWGSILYYILVIVTSPMICCGNWAMSMFLWACLLMVSLRELRKLRKV
ncbi:MAG: hypothetical protein ACI3VD_05375 [Candidatus Limivicinus sp.]